MAPVGRLRRDWTYIRAPANRPRMLIPNGPTVKATSGWLQLTPQAKGSRHGITCPAALYIGVAEQCRSTIVKLPMVSIAWGLKLLSPALKTLYNGMSGSVTRRI